MNKDLIVIGIGSSAGGLEALQILMKELPDLDNCSYIIAQHLSPTHKSMMVDLLGRVTNIPVIEIKNGLKIKPKTVYITPENTDVFLRDNKIFLKNVEQSFGPKPSVNYLFSSLANEYKERAIGIILSGTGSDGSYGIRAIKAEGGLTIAQSPTTAKYDGMPNSAINTGKVDLVVKIDELAQEISRVANNINQNKPFNLNDRLLQQVYRMLFEEKGADFSLYKKNTVNRRIERRISALRLNSLLEYVEKIKTDKNEIHNLYHDILIGVTSFFRDKEAFEALKLYLEQIISKKEQGEEIRFWSIACSTGEEAYSLAIILAEILQERIDKYKIKIFATDIDDESLKLARAGIYPETSLMSFDKKIIQRYFTVQKNQFEIKKSIRELVIFSKHNIISDSPFLRLDLIVCRNLLIYFNQTLQNKFFPIVHYALKDNGLLFLGKSESVGQFIDLFNIIDKNAKIFKAQYTGIKEPPKLYSYSSYKNEDVTKYKNIKNDEEIFEDKIIEGIKEQLFNKCLVINSSNDIIYVKGKIPYIQHKEGKITNNIFKLIDDDIALELRSAITTANKTKKTTFTSFCLLTIFENITKYVRIIITPMKDAKTDDWINILFFQTEEAENIKGHIFSDGDDNETIRKLQKELDTTKSHLQNVIEELETSYEEMQGLNEELQSSNEELQSSNEELETTNEELQSTNEELQTAYSELKVLYEDKENRTKQLEELTEKLSRRSNDARKQKELTEGIINTAPTSIIMLDEDGHITFSNTNAQKFFNLSKKELLYKTYSSKDWNISSLTGEPIDDEKLPFNNIKKKYESIYNFRHTIIIDNKKYYVSINTSPLFDVNGKFTGAILCIDDLTSNFNLQNDLEMYKNSKINEISTDNINFFELYMLSLNTDIRSQLNDLSFLIKDQNNTASQVETIRTSIEDITKSLQKKIDYFGFGILNKEVLLKDEFENIYKEYFEFLEDNNINVKIDLNSVTEKINKKTLRTLNYALIELFLNIQNDLKKEINITINCENQKENYINIIFEDFILEDNISKFESNITALENINSNIEIKNNQLKIYIN